MNPTFLNLDGSLSNDGEQLIAYIEGQFVEADKTNNLEILNNLSGMIGHYYVNVYKTRTMNREQWVKEFPNGAMNAWNAKTYMESLQAQAEKVEQTADQTNVIAGQLEALRKELDSAKVEIAALKEDKPKRGRKPKAQEETEAEADTEVDTESEA